MKYLLFFKLRMETLANITGSLYQHIWLIREILLCIPLPVGECYRTFFSDLSVILIYQANNYHWVSDLSLTIFMKTICDHLGKESGIHIYSLLSSNLLKSELEKGWCWHFVRSLTVLCFADLENFHFFMHFMEWAIGYQELKYLGSLCVYLLVQYRL